MSEDLLGRTLRGEYEIREVLGRGGMATVYRAYSRSLDADVAIKVLTPRLAVDRGFRQRFRDEARSLAGLHHPNLIEVHQFGEDGDLVFIVMRLVPGGTLKDRLQGIEGPLDLISTARLMSQVADALQHAHDGGLVHLDIKPANILLGRADWPLLADFGITRAVESQATDGGGHRLAGTPLYMSPEQCVGGQVDGRSDQYSLAITAYELMTGHRPFSAPTTEELLQHHIHRPPRRPRELNPGLPGPVEDVLLRALSKSPDQRFPTIHEFGDALTTAIERTRGVTLETKAALAGVVPNLVAVLVLVVLGPLSIGLLPGGALVAGKMPIAWPVLFLLATAIAALLLGIRWHVIGLLTRLVRAALGGLNRASREYGATRVASATPPGAPSWQNAVAGSVEGAVNLAYVFAVYRLISAPALALVGFFFGPTTQQIATTALSVLVVMAALWLILSLFRFGGSVVAAISLTIGWIAASALPATDTGFGAAFPLAWAVKGALGLAIVALLLATRRTVHPLVRRLTALSAGRLVAEEGPGLSQDRLVARRRHLEALAVSASDLLYLLAGYGILRSPALDGLQLLVGPLPAAIVVTCVAGLPWVLLVARLHRLAGPFGVGLGILLGAPLLLSFPVLEERVLGVTWPITAATWGVGTLLILLMAAVRGQVQSVGQRALGQRLDQSLLGVASAASEEQAERRAGALGGVAGALIDVGFLVIAYWILGVPAAEALSAASGQTGVGSLILVGLLIGTIIVLFGPIRRATGVLGETGGAAWATRSRMVLGSVVAMAMLLVSSCVATPAVLAVPRVAGGLTLDPPPAPVVNVDWEYWLPWTPSEEYGAYNLALSCSNGRSLGQFREATLLDPSSAVQSGSIGQLGRTGVNCDDWRTIYFGHRRSAGLSERSSVSWDWLDAEIVVRDDGAVDVVEKHRVLFTNGVHGSLRWRQPVIPDFGTPVNLEVWEGDLRYLFAAEGEDAPRRARVWEEGGERGLSWSFPEVASPAERTYTIRYRLESGAGAFASRRRLELPIIAPNRDEVVWRGTVAVRLPQDFPVQNAVLSSIGAPSRHGLLNGLAPWFETRDVPPSDGWTIVVDFPSEPTETPTPEPTVTPASTPTPVPPPTVTPSPTAEPSHTPTPTQVAVAAKANTSSPVALAPLATRTATPRPPTATATPIPTATVEPTATLTATQEPACAGDERMSFSSANPNVGQEFVIAVTSRKPHTDVRLSGPENPSGPFIRQTGDGVVWEWRARADSAGRKDYNFFVQSSTLCTTNYTVVNNPPPPPPPTNTPTPVPTVTPTSTPCPGGLEIDLGLVDNGDGTVAFNWMVLNSCDPISGTITAAFSDPPPTAPPFMTYDVSTPSGEDSHTVPCGDNLQIEYTFTLTNGNGQVQTIVRNLDGFWGCG